jgi:hypothetical protein
LLLLLWVFLGVLFWVGRGRFVGIGLAPPTPVDSNKLHVTLHFLGNQPTARLPEFLDGFRVPFDPFHLQFGRAELQRSGIAWIAPHSEPQGLLDLHARLLDALLALGLVPWVERHYRDRVEPKDLADPQLAIECAAALEDLERILGVPGLYDLA